MGRYFRTARPEFVDDNIFELPTELMGKVILNTDEQIQEGEDLKNSYLAKLLEVDAIEQDKSRRKELVGGWETKIDELTKDIQTDPLGFRRKIGDIKKLGRELNIDMTRGELSGIQSRFDTRADLIKRHQDMMKKDPDKYGGGDFNALLSYLDNPNYNPAIQYNEDTGTYNQYKTEDLLANEDLNENFKTYLEDMKASSRETTIDKESGDKRWIIKVNNKTEALTEQELLQVAWDNFSADRDVQNFLKQRSKIGTMSGIYDESGQFISPFSVENVTDKKGKVTGQRVNWNTESGLMPAIRGAVERSSYMDTVYKREMEANPYALIDAREASQRRLKDYDKYSNLPDVIIDGKSVVVPSLAGTTEVLAQYNIQAYEEAKQGLADNVKPIFDRALGADNELAQDYYQQVKSGNFESLRTEEAKELLGIDDEYINDLEHQYKQIGYRQKIVEQKLAEARDAVESGEYATTNEYLEATKNRTLGITATWDVLPDDTPELKSDKAKIIKQSQDLFDNMALMGTVKMVSNDPRFDGKTLNDIVKEDKARVAQGMEPILRIKKAGDVTETLVPNEDGDGYTTGQQDNRYATLGFENLSINKGTVAPTTQPMGDGTIALQAHAEIEGAGVTFYMSTKDINNTGLKNSIEQNAHNIEAANLIRQSSDVNQFEPVDGVLIDHENGNITIKYDDGTWVGGMAEGQARLGQLFKYNRL